MERVLLYLPLRLSPTQHADKIPDDVRPGIFTVSDRPSAQTLAKQLAESLPSDPDVHVICDDGLTRVATEALAVHSARMLLKARCPWAFEDGAEPRLRRTSECDVFWSTVWYLGRMTSAGVIVDKCSGIAMMRFYGEMANAGLL